MGSCVSKNSSDLVNSGISSDAVKATATPTAAAVAACKDASLGASNHGPVGLDDSARVVSLAVADAAAAAVQSAREAAASCSKAITSEAHGAAAAQAGSASGLPAFVMRKARIVMQELALIEPDGLRTSFCKACEALLRQLQPDAVHVSLMGYTSSYDAYIMAGAAGACADALLQHLLLTGPQWSAARCGPDCGMQPLYVTVAESSQAGSLPQDWAQLHHEAGLRTFMTVPISSAADNPLGVLVLAGQQPKMFMEDWWGPLLSIVCTSLVPLLSCPLMTGFCSLAGSIVDARNQLHTQCELYIRGASSLLQAVTNLPLHVRLGILSPDNEEVLLLHAPIEHEGQGADGDADADAVSSIGEGVSARMSYCSGAQHAELSMVRLPASETMLMEAVAFREPRHLLNMTREYLEDNTRVAADVVVQAGTTRSIVVMPLFLDDRNDAAFGGMYITHSKPSWFEESRGAIMALNRLIQSLLDEQVLTKPDQAEWSRLLQEVTAASSSGVSSSYAIHSTHGSSCCRTGPLLRGVSGGILQAVQQELLDLQSSTQGNTGEVEDIQLQRVLGIGGFGTVYDGIWKGCKAAIKVMFVPDNLRRQMKLALEMATLATISHPNIVRVFSCMPDMVESSSAQSGLVTKPHQITYRAAQPEDYATGTPTCNLMVMEVCEGGNLLNAISKGLLHTRVSNGTLSVNMPLLLGVLLDVAHGIQHLHSLKLVHCDIKPENILLQQCSSSPAKGFVAKLSDFGLMKAMHGDTLALFNRSVSGTVTHLAPERLVNGALLTPAVDVWAFGMIMYEAYTGRRPFENMRPAAVVTRIASGGKPEFPPGSPPLYQQLAEACWAHDAQLRPSMEQIVQLLQDWMGTLAAVQRYASSLRIHASQPMPPHGQLVMPQPGC